MRVNGGFPYLTVEDGDYLKNNELYIKHWYEGIELDLKYLEKFCLTSTSYGEEACMSRPCSKINPSCFPMMERLSTADIYKGCILAAFFFKAQRFQLVRPFKRNAKLMHVCPVLRLHYKNVK